MSDSSIALKPVIEEPSKPIPCSSPVSSSSLPTEKLFSCPWISVNQKRMKSTSSFSTLLRISSAVVFDSLLIVLRLLFPPERADGAEPSGLGPACPIHFGPIARRGSPPRAGTPRGAPAGPLRPLRRCGCESPPPPAGRRSCRRRRPPCVH